MDYKEIIRVSKMTPQELERFCYNNGLENARAYDEAYLKNYAMTIVLRKKEK